MKSKFLLPLVLLGGLTLVGCGNQPAPVGPVVTTTVTISNKTALQAEWHVGDAGRELSLTLDPDGNIMQLIADGDLTTTSSNNSVVGVSGVGLSALGAGTATVTVNYKGATDTVEITVAAKQTAKEKYGVAHEGTAADPFTNEDALTVAAHADYNSEDYYVRGEVASFYHAPGSRTDGYVSWFLKPAEGKTDKFEVYKCKKADGTALTDQDVWVGAIATAHGTFTKYGEQYETSEGSIFVKSEGEPPAQRTTIQSTLAEVLTIGKALEDGADTYNYYEFTGFVTKKDGKNYFLTATKGEAITDVKANTFEIYSASDAVAAKLLKDAEVKVKAVVKNYHGQVENLLALDAADVTVVTPGTDWVAPTGEAVTVTQALAKINAIDLTGATDKQTIYVENEKIFDVTGIVVKKGATWTDESKYKNADFYIADTADAAAEAQLQVFRFADKAVFDEMAVGDTVKVTCKLAAYISVKDGVASIAARETNAGPSAVIVSKGQGGGGGQDVPPAGTKVSVTIAANLFTADATNAKIATYTSGDATFTLDQNDSTTANRLSDTDHLRVYKNAKLGVAVAGKTFKTVDITVSGESYAAVANFTDTGATVTVSGTTVRLTFAESVSAFSFVAGAQVRVTAVAYYAD